jgi:glycosyltransferase involved in cell wall biosynthesis
LGTAMCTSDSPENPPRILFHVTVPTPAIEGTDALFQEVDRLQARFGGQRIFLYPFHRPGIPFPRWLYGLHQLHKLMMLDQQVDLHHVFDPGLFPYPALSFLTRPKIRTIVASLRTQTRRPWWLRPSFGDRVIVSNRRDARTLQSWGFNSKIIYPSIDISRFTVSRPTAPHFTLMCGSAPWVPNQFAQKGIDALLDAAQLLPDLRLVFLWRGILLDQMQQRIRRRNLESRVQVINRKVDVNQVLGRVHASVALADRPEIVKAYPHSLLESLAANKPVLISQCIPMADYVAERGCGEVVTSLNPKAVARGVQQLIERYDTFQANTVGIAERNFSQDAMLRAHQSVYSDALACTSHSGGARTQ